jgi:hypothetical protein
VVYDLVYRRVIAANKITHLERLNESSQGFSEDGNVIPLNLDDPVGGPPAGRSLSHD